MISPGMGAVGSAAFIFSIYKGWLPYTSDANFILRVLIVVIPLIIFGYTFQESSFLLLLRVTGRRKSWMPVYVSRLGFFDTIVIVFLIGLKYLFRGIRLVPGYKVAADGKHILLPELRLDASMVLDDSDYARYDAATKNQSVAVKTTSPVKSAGESRLLLFPGLTTPIMLVLMANRYLPVLPFGAVNTKNRFEFVDPAACRDPIRHLELGSKLTVNARIGGDSLLGRRVKRGVEFDVVVEVKAPRKGESQVKVVFRQYITILASLSSSAKPLFDSTQLSVDGEEKSSWAKQPSSAVRLNSSSPGKWASVCKDYNPIHVSSILAKLFGFPGKIAHGNHAVACALDELQNSKDSGFAEKGFRNVLVSSHPFFVDAEFKRPMVLPIDLVIRCGSSKDSKSFLFSAEKGEKEHISARAGELRD